MHLVLHPNPSFTETQSPNPKGLSNEEKRRKTMSSLGFIGHLQPPKQPVRILPPPPPAPAPGVAAATPAEVLSALVQIKAAAEVLHFVQSERGVTCSLLASAGKHPFFEGTLEVHRAATNEVLANTVDTERHEQLATLRLAADEAVVAAAELSRAPSHDAAGAAGATGTAGAHDADCSAEQAERSRPYEAAISHASAFLATFTGFDQLVGDVQAELDEVLPSCSATTIFAAFAQLKDAVGVVRAFVAATLVMPDDALAAVSEQLRGTLVVCLHRQIACTATIRASAPRKLLSLVGAGIGLPPELAAVYAQLEVDFSVGALRESLSVESWWSVASSHLEKLQ